MGVPPGRVTVAAVRRRLIRRRIKETAGVLAVVVVAAIGVAASGRVFGAAPRSAAPHRPTASTVYVAYTKGGGESPPVKPLPGARSSRSTRPPTGPGSRSESAGGDQIAITPDGKTATSSTALARSSRSARHQHGWQADPRRPQPRLRPRVHRDHPGREDGLRRQHGPEHRHPDQRGHQHRRQADPRRPRPVWIAITPDGKTAYVVNEPHTSGSPARSPRSARPPTGLASRSRRPRSLSRSRSRRTGRPPT